jgi:hypothetical protein
LGVFFLRRIVFKAAFSFDRNVFIDAQRNLVNSPKLLQRAMKRRQPRLKKLTLAIVAVEPGLPKPGITKKMTPRQRRAFWATDGFGHGIPYRRTGALTEAWDAQFVFDADGGSFVIENTSPIATYVIGDQQQVFHRDTGWIDAEEVIDSRVVPLVMNDFEETFYSIADPFTGRST